MASIPDLDATKKKSDSYYDATWRWIEDTYLKYFGENRTSYGVKESLKSTEVTGNKDIDGIQRQAGETVGNTFGANGLAGGVGDALDKNVIRGRTN